METVKIKDSNIAHDLSTSPGKGPTHFKWVRDNDPADEFTFITDLHLHQHLNSNSIAWLLEPPSVNPNIYKFTLENKNKYKYILTFSQELIDRCDNALFYPVGGTRLMPNEYGLYSESKCKMASVILSDKQCTSGHKFRHKCKDLCLMSHTDVDVYLPKVGECISKLDACADYMFSVVVENGIYDDYFTEKIIDCFLSGVIPIYCGTGNIEKYFDDRGIIQFKNLAQLDKILPTLSKDTYYNKIKYVENNYKKAVTNYCIAEDWLYNNYPFLYNSEEN